MTYLISCYKNQSNIKTWIDLELELKVFVQNVDSLMDSLNGREYNTNYNVFMVRSRSINLSYAFLINQLVSIFDFDNQDATIKKEYINIWWKIDKEKIFETIQKELIELSKMLEYYLINVEPVVCGPINIRDDISNINPSYVISFNYTDTIQELNGVNSNDICYVHGEINKNNIVLGYDDSEKETTNLQFKKYYQRLIYDTDRIDYNRLYESDAFGGVVDYDNYFFGHSLDSSDKDILNDLFSQGNKIYIFYKDIEDKNRKIKNIISIIGKEPAEKRITKDIIFYTSKNVCS